MINLFSPFREKLALDRDWGRRETGKVQTHGWYEVGLFVREGFTPQREGCAFATTCKEHRKELPLSAPFWAHLSYSQGQARGCFHITVKC